MAKAGSDGLITIAGGDVMNAIVDNHEAPMVISSVMKQNCTERGRRIVECGMDVAAGSAICRGDKNYIGNAYMSLPKVPAGKWNSGHSKFCVARDLVSSFVPYSSTRFPL